MAIPKQVEKQMREVEEIEKQMAPVPSEAPPPEEPTSPETPPADQPLAPDPAAVSNIVDIKQPNEWEHKYRTLDGMYKAEVPKLHGQVKELTAQIAGLVGQIEALKMPTPPVAADERLVSDKDVEAFGEDLIDVQRRVAREVMREVVAPLKAELKQRDEKISLMEQSLAKTGGDVATMSF